MDPTDPTDATDPVDSADSNGRPERLEPPGLLDQEELRRAGRAVGLGVLLGFTLVLLGRRTRGDRTD